MTPAQQAALEGIAGRPLSAEEIAALDPLVAARNDVGIAALLPPRIVIESRPIGIGTILAVLAPDGGDFLNALEALGAQDANVKWALKLIEQSNFDVGMAETRTQLQTFAASKPEMQVGVDALLAVAERASAIHYNEVSDALNVAEGRLTLGG